MGPHWLELRADLAASVGHEFESYCERVIRLAWPNVRRASEMSALDKSGFDLADCTTSRYLLHVAVQCKTTSKIPISSSFSQKVTKDVSKVLASEIEVLTFIYVVNAPGMNAELKQELSDLLEPLRHSPRVRYVHFVDAAEFVALVFRETSERLDRALQIQHVGQHLSALDSAAPSPRILHRVPVRVVTLDVSKDSILRVAADQIIDDFEPTALIPENRASRVTLLSGLFGSGKSIAIAQLVTGGIGTCFTLACSQLPLQWTSPLSAEDLAEWVFALAAAQFERDDGKRPLFREVMLEVLRSHGWQKTLIFDALDEHRRLCTADHFLELARAASALGCNIVFTVRKELIGEELGRFELALRHLCRTLSATSVKRVELLPWKSEQLIRLIDHCCEIDPAVQLHRDELTIDRWKSLKQAICDHSAEKLFGDCLGNPLLFSYLLEDVATSGLRRLNRADIFFNHIVRKLLRDRAITSRPQPGIDIGNQPWWCQMITAMLPAALAVDHGHDESQQSNLPDDHRQLESFDLQELRGFFHRPFSGRATKDEIIACGLFVTRIDPFTGAERFYFTHKALQDFLVALAIYTFGGDHSDDTIRQLRDEISAACTNTADSELASYVRMFHAWKMKAMGAAPNEMS